MTINHLSHLPFITAIPLTLTLIYAGSPAEAAEVQTPQTAPKSEPAPNLSAEEAEAETARILARLSSIKSPAPSPASVAVASPRTPAPLQADEQKKLPIELATALPEQMPVPAPVQETASDSGEDITSALQAIRSELSEQRKLIARQSALIRTQNEKIQQLELHNQLVLAAFPGTPTSPYDLSRMRGAGIQKSQLETAAVQIGTQPDDSLALPDEPVGEAPPPSQNIERKVEAVPEGQGVLTPRGQFVLDPSIEYTRSSTNRLVFRGFELIPGIQIGAIEASDADRDTIIGTFAMRYGLTNRLEIEGRIPLLYRKDRIKVVQQRDEQITREVSLEETNIGDAEFALRYQLNRPTRNNPIWVAGLRVKTDTGKSPYEIPFDDFGVATGLATGSGFWGVQPSLSFLLPSDPVVIYGGIGYLWNIERNIDKLVGDVFVGKVDPGDAINASVGFGFALNPRFSFSLGYRHNYIFSTTTQLGDTLQESDDIQVGSFNLGMSYRLSERQSLNLGFQFGATEDAPDVSIVARIPFRF
ncbi:MAG: outer membrane beta-barrel protein [Sphingorhabdus sp.]|nr:outer membrane beta-barrel protein [Sphingorhabdus sp.]